MCVLADSSDINLLANAAMHAHQKLRHDVWIRGVLVLHVKLVGLFHVRLHLFGHLMAHRDNGTDERILECPVCEHRDWYFDCGSGELTDQSTACHNNVLTS